MKPIHVLFVDDDPDYREVMADELSDHGFSVRSFPDGASLLGALSATADADVIVLDWALPEMSGIDLLSQLRRHGVGLPVVFLTSHSHVAIERQAFANGAIDFIDKTRGGDIVARRLRLAAEPPVVTAGGRLHEGLVSGKLILKPAANRAHWRDVEVDLTLTEYKVVDLLVSNAGSYLTYRAIYDRMHYDGFFGGHGDQGYKTNVRACIRRIRRKFCKLDPRFGQIENSSSFGYRWRGPAPR
jgi:two-component system response regulator ChvI